MSAARLRTWLAVAAGLFVLAACGRGPPDFRATNLTGVAWGRDFRLEDTAGRPRTLADFRGKAVLIFFGYSHCPDVCPTTLAKMARAVHRLGDHGKRVQGVQGLFVTIDPKRDTPAVLARFVILRSELFIGLRGSEVDVMRTTVDFKVFSAGPPADAQGAYAVEHSRASLPSTQGAGCACISEEMPMSTRWFMTSSCCCATDTAADASTPGTAIAKANLP